MSTLVFANFPVSNLERSIAFYSSLGFKANEEMSSPEGCAMVWDDHFWVMLLTHESYREFIGDKDIPDSKTMSGSLVSFSLESPEAVKKFAETAKQNGGDYYEVDIEVPENQMYFFEVVDPDGNILEPLWMKM
ncbi:VOC family protein [Vagococcus elongatus]|uniref:Glyoxalase n=1 Tax=Vagococcus elongatus TaxID=180344 RepID=A0A430ANE4_9ENTE|nr:VOC family protein [Vagococcus elongatus]RSU09586.1 glyoxalase [Vagococcus elongatus]